MRRDTLAFSTHILLSQVLSNVRPSSWTWTMIMLTRLRKSNFRIKIKMSDSPSIEIHEVSSQMDAIYLEAVEQAQFVYCYHAWLTLSLWSDGTPAAVSHSLGQVSGAADQVERIHSWGDWKIWKEKNDI